MTPAFPSTATRRSGSPGSTRARWARWPTARSGCRFMRPPIRRAARSTGGCSCPRAGTTTMRGAAPRTCPSRYAIDPSGSWCWTWWTSLAAGGFTRRWWSPTPAMGSRGSCVWGWRRAGWPMWSRSRRTTSAYPEAVAPQVAPYAGRGRRPRPRYRAKRSSLAELVLAAGPSAAKTVAWREGTRGRLRSRFVALRVRPAGVKLRRAAAGRGAAGALAAGRMARRPARAGQVLAGQPARRHPAGGAGPAGQAPLAHRARLPRAQRRPRTWTTSRAAASAAGTIT